jgi:hypothetical protein
MSDFTRAIGEVRPAMGADEEALAALMPMGLVGTFPKCHAHYAGEIAKNAAKVSKITCSDAGESAQNAAKVPKMYRPDPTPRCARATRGGRR